MIKEIKAAVTIPVMAKARIGHFVEAQILEAVGIDYIDESEVRGLLFSWLSLRPGWLQLAAAAALSDLRLAVWVLRPGGRGRRRHCRKQGG